VSRKAWNRVGWAIVVGCFGVTLVVTRLETRPLGPHFTQESAPVYAPVYATVDDVYAALTNQMGGATPDFETQVKPILDLHLTYAELQA
jgi:hypothetical protein